MSILSHRGPPKRTVGTVPVALSLFFLVQIPSVPYGEARVDVKEKYTEKYTEANHHLLTKLEQT
jgi:hypothetical protein